MPKNMNCKGPFMSFYREKKMVSAVSDFLRNCSKDIETCTLHSIALLVLINIVRSQASLSYGVDIITV